MLYAVVAIYLLIGLIVYAHIVKHTDNVIVILMLLPFAIVLPIALLLLAVVKSCRIVLDNGK